MTAPFAFSIAARDGAARVGRLTTGRGEVRTPAFMPVGTAATVKAMTPEAVAQTGAEIILANTYHLMLRPGAERIEGLGGLNRFMHWPGPILTDSGGFQVMSLAKLRRLDETGVTFQSHVDGSRHQLTPERAIAIQRALGATIAMVLDECTPYPASAAAAADSMRLSLRWAERSRAAFRPEPGTALFGIVQGGVHGALRAESAAGPQVANGTPVGVTARNHGSTAGGTVTMGGFLMTVPARPSRDRLLAENHVPPLTYSGRWSASRPAGMRKYFVAFARTAAAPDNTSRTLRQRGDMAS